MHRQPNANLMVAVITGQLRLQGLYLRGFTRLTLELNLGDQLFMQRIPIDQAHPIQNVRGLIEPVGLYQCTGIGQGHVLEPVRVFPGSAQQRQGGGGVAAVQ